MGSARPPYCLHVGPLARNPGVHAPQRKGYLDRLSHALVRSDWTLLGYALMTLLALRWSQIRPQRLSQAP